MNAVLPSNRNARDVEPESIDYRMAGDVKRLPIGVAPSHVAKIIDFDAPEQISFGIDNMDAARAAAVEVAFDVDLHAVGPASLFFHLVKQPAVFEAAVGLNVESENVAPPRVVHVQQRFIG